MHFVLYVLLGMLICTAIDYGLLFCEINIFTWTCLFVIPVGGMLLGMVIGGMAICGMKRDNADFDRFQSVFLVLASIVLIVFLTYFDYMTCFINENGEINRFFKGVHVRQATPYYNFWNYYYREYFLSNVNVHFKGVGDTELKGSGVLNFIAYLLQYIGIIIMSRWVAEMIKFFDKCDNCGKYTKTKVIDRFYHGIDYEKMLIMFETNLANVDRYTPKHRRGDARVYCYSLKAHYCPECRIGKLMVYQYVSNGRNSRDVPLVYKNVTSDTLVKLGLVKGNC